MAMEPKLPGWGLWGRWVLLSAVGFTASAFLGMSLAWALIGIVPTGDTTPEFFSMAYLDAMFGLDEERWHALKYGAFYAPGGKLLSESVTIILGGLGQWLVLRRHAERAVWWSLPVPLVVAYWGMTADNPLPVGGGVTLIAFYAKDVGIFAALCSMIVGAPLIWFLRRSYRKVAAG